MILTACLIVRNEREFLQGCIESIRRVTPDVVVVDTGSDDGTPELAENLGCTVFAYKWQDDFSAARNYALEKAAGNWILAIDADERVDWQGTQAELYTLLSHTDFQAFRVPILSYVGPQQSGAATVSDERVILFRSDPMVRFQHRVHEDISESLAARFGTDLRIGRIPLKVEHLGYLDQVVIRRKKHERNIRLLEMEIQEGGVSPWTDYCLGTEWSSCAEWEKALPPLERVLRQAPQAPYWELAAYNLAYDYLQLGSHIQCMEICNLALQSGRELECEWRLLKKMADWLTCPTLANMLAACPGGAPCSPDDYQAFIFAYLFALRRVFNIEARP